MNAITTKIPDVVILEPQEFHDDRGFFLESYNARTFAQVIGVQVDFVQDNHAYSIKNVLRGLHYQIQQPQGKLVRVVRGVVFDVAVDIRSSSPTFGQWVGVELSEQNKKQLWIPEGFAHGYIVRSECADFEYKATDYYAPQYERCIDWNDPVLGIDWSLDSPPHVSTKDQLGQAFGDAEVFP